MTTPTNAANYVPSALLNFNESKSTLLHFTSVHLSEAHLRRNAAYHLDVPARLVLLHEVLLHLEHLKEQRWTISDALGNQLLISLAKEK